MMTAQEFDEGVSIPFCGRGKDLKAISARVKAVEDGATAATLIAVLTAAIGWGWKKGKKHGDKPSKNFSIRLQKVRQLVMEAEQELTGLGLDAVSIRKAALSYEQKKMSGKKGGLRSLQKGYSQERKQFDSLKKGGVSKDTPLAPKSGSLVSEVLMRGGKAKLVASGSDGTLGDLVDPRNSPKEYKTMKAVHGKDIKQISPAQYDEIVEMVESGAWMGMVSQRNEVNFVRKTDRVEKFLAWCENGLFYKQNGLPYTSSGHEIYAMDKYGNLVTMPIGVFFAKTGRKYSDQGDAQHNHSSLNAGADVISAGEIEFRQGKIVWIDNASGHYKPSARQLQNCVQSLHLADDADLSELKGQAWDGKDWKTFNNATTFLAARF